MLSRKVKRFQNSKLLKSQPVFSVVDTFRRRSQDSDILSIEAHSDIVRKLTSHTQDRSFGTFLKKTNGSFSTDSPVFWYVNKVFKFKV
jgi:hypothetical protein